MTRLIAVSLCLLATPALAQVQVSARTEKSSFLAGEPIFVVVDIKNVGDEPIGYNGGTIGRPPLTFVVANGTPKPVVSLSACGSPVSGPAIGMVDHPPLLKPGAQISRRYLVGGYRLTPGSYELRVAGHADVRWKYYPTLGNGLPAPPPKHQDSDPVEGALVDQTLPLVIVAGTEAEREAAFKPYVANAMEIYSESGLQSALAIFELAPPFLEAEIVKLVRYAGNRWGITAPAASALAEINSPTSRRELIAWFDRSEDLRMRERIVDAIARARQPDYLEFLSSLLPGRSTAWDDQIRTTAAFGIAGIGGPAAVQALAAAPTSPNRLVQMMVVRALGNTGEKSAVPVLIDRVTWDDGSARNEICGALIQLTHYQWCDGNPAAEMQARWRRFWASNGSTMKIYPADKCVELAGLPFI